MGFPLYLSSIASSCCRFCLSDSLTSTLVPYSDAFFYYLFPELPPGTRYIEMDPGIADAAGSGLAGELHRSMWLIQSDVWSNWDEPNSSAHRGSPLPNRVVADEYCTVVRTPQFRLLQRCGAGLEPKR